MKKEGWFKVSSEIKNILGRDLITDSNIAVLELVKNSYDANAKKVTITFGEDSLTISDDGKGMTEDDILNKWLLLAYSAKKDYTEDSNYRDKIKRKYAGSKGIGRLSCDRLGRKLVLTTKSANDSNVIEMTIDWHEYELNPHVEFDRIPVSYQILDHSDKISDATGTILHISGLHDSWSSEEILSLRKSLEKLINPFNGADDFEIFFIVPSEIENDQIKRTESQKLRKNWETLSIQKQTTAVKLERSIINGPIKNSIGEVLNLKTTRIDSIIKDGVIQTIITDRGVKIYEIKESNKFDLLKDVSISLFYLNKLAKYNFSLQMGTSAVNYGSVFLFRNGFRILPYGQFGHDGWGIDQRIQQGYNRFLGSRELLGRVDVETDDPEAFKEVSSRDGGLINTPAFQQLKEFFWLTHKRLERYVVGVLWGEGFLRREYFQKDDDAKSLRLQLQKTDKESETIDHVLTNIGSKVDFLQIVKTLTNDDTITLIYYNEDLANIVSNVDDTEIIQNQLIDDLRKVATKTNDTTLVQNLKNFEAQLDELRHQKHVAERLAETEKERAKEAIRKAREEKEKREKERLLRLQAEKERDAQKQQNRYLNSVRDTSKEVEDIIHAVMLSATEISSLVEIQEILLEEDILNRQELKENIHDIRVNLNRINTWSSLITRANANLLRESIDVDIISYCKEFMSIFERQYTCTYINKHSGNIIKKISILDLSLVLLNMISNCGKNNAHNVHFIFDKNGATVSIQISDDGDGVDLKRFTAESIFEVGVTSRPGGSGIGLSTVRSIVNKSLHGSIEFIGNGLNKMKGATFQIILQ